jgi:hypothetical protein
MPAMAAAPTAPAATPFQRSIARDRALDAHAAATFAENAPTAGLAPNILQARKAYIARNKGLADFSAADAGFAAPGGHFFQQGLATDANARANAMNSANVAMVGGQANVANETAYRLGRETDAGLYPALIASQTGNYGGYGLGRGSRAGAARTPIDYYTRAYEASMRAGDTDEAKFWHDQMMSAPRGASAPAATTPAASTLLSPSDVATVNKAVQSAPAIPSSTDFAGMMSNAVQSVANVGNEAAKGSPQTTPVAPAPTTMPAAPAMPSAANGTAAAAPAGAVPLAGLPPAALGTPDVNARLRLPTAPAAPSAPAAPQTSSRPLTPDIARSILAEAGGNKDVARQLAAQRGYDTSRLAPTGISPAQATPNGEGWITYGKGIEYRPTAESTASQIAAQEAPKPAPTTGQLFPLLGENPPQPKAQDFGVDPTKWSQGQLSAWLDMMAHANLGQNFASPEVRRQYTDQLREWVTKVWAPRQARSYTRRQRDIDALAAAR